MRVRSRCKRLLVHAAYKLQLGFPQIRDTIWICQTMPTMHDTIYDRRMSVYDNQLRDYSLA